MPLGIVFFCLSFSEMFQNSMHCIVLGRGLGNIIAIGLVQLRIVILRLLRIRLRGLTFWLKCRLLNTLRCSVLYFRFVNLPRVFARVAFVFFDLENLDYLCFCTSMTAVSSTPATAPLFAAAPWQTDLGNANQLLFHFVAGPFLFNTFGIEYADIILAPRTLSAAFPRTAFVAFAARSMECGNFPCKPAA